MRLGEHCEIGILRQDATGLIQESFENRFRIIQGLLGSHPGVFRIKTTCNAKNCSQENANHLTFEFSKYLTNIMISTKAQRKLAKIS